MILIIFLNVQNITFINNVKWLEDTSNYSKKLSYLDNLKNIMDIVPKLLQKQNLIFKSTIAKASLCYELYPNQLAPLIKTQNQMNQNYEPKRIAVLFKLDIINEFINRVYEIK